MIPPAELSYEANAFIISFGASGAVMILGWFTRTIIGKFLLKLKYVFLPKSEKPDLLKRVMEDLASVFHEHPQDFLKQIIQILKGLSDSDALPAPEEKKEKDQ